MRASRTTKAAILAGGQAATALVSLGIAAVLARVFDKSDYATYRQTLLAYNMAAPLLSLGLPTAIFYFMPGEQNRARGILLENLTLLGLAGLLFALFLLSGGNVLLANHFNNPALEKTLFYFAFYPVLALPASATTACLMARDKVTWVALYTIGARLATLVVVLGAVWLLSPTPEIAILATTAAAVLTLGFGLGVMFGSVRATQGSIGWGGFKAQLAYSIPMGLGGMIATMHRSVDKLLVSLFTEPENFAVYVNGAMEIPFIGIIAGSATAVLLPEMRQLLKANEREQALQIWKRAGIKAGVFIVPMMGILFATAPDVMAIIYGEAYRESHQVFRVYLLLLPIRIVIFGAVFQAAGRTDLLLKRAIIALVANVLLSVIFARLFGYVYIATATVAAIYFAVLPYCLWKVSEIFQTRVKRVFPWGQVLKLLLLTGIALLIALVVTFFCPWDVAIVRASLVGVVYALVMGVGLPRAGFLRFDLSRGVALPKRVVWTLRV
ncbi:MAG: oligosaccharide flippase family protein [Roseibacillus sp.]|nr:oligosaccharide flippase family protein [Roseibacillus sp.]